MDAGRRDEEDRLGAAAAAALNGHHHSQRHHHPIADSSDLAYSTYAPAYHNDQDFRDRHDRDPIAAYATNNFAAFAANSAGVDSQAPAPSNDYYRAAQHYDDITDFADSDYDDPMASALPVPRHPAGAPPRSNRTPTKPPSSLTNSQNTRAGLRSVSAPVDEKALSASRARAAAVGVGGHKPSVKDLKKKFDSDTAQGTSNIPRKPAPRASSRGPATPSSARGMSSPVSGRDTSYAALRSSAADRDFDKTPSTTRSRSTQRARAVPEDQVSNNPQSFASRVTKPRVPRNSNAQVPSRPKPSSHAQSMGSLPSPKQTRGLLFGEIMPGESDVGSVGFGIEGFSDAGQNAKLHGRSLSQSEIEPPSPSDWYRDTSTASGQLSNEDVQQPATATKKHSRAHSDDPTKKANTQRSKPTQPSRPPPAASSRLPIAVRNNMSASSSSASPPSSRAASPAFAKRQAQAQSKTTSGKGSTPTSGTSRRGITASTSMPSTNNRLNAYIAPPIPKLSPPLRSSRPRQPVSTASTASSRIRAAETQRSKSPTKTDSKASTKTGEPGTRRRKISMGPIDFESRREQIKLSYTKSIKETEARAAARRIAEEKKKAKLLADAKAERVAQAEEQKREEQKRLEEQSDLEARQKAEEPQDEENTIDGEAESTALTSDTHQTTEAPQKTEPPVFEQPILTLTTDLAHDAPPPVPAPQPTQFGSSPEFVLPGSFPALASPPLDQDEPPPSAVSDTTEFDNEPQTDPPVQAILPRLEVNTAPYEREDVPIHPRIRSVYRSPFDDDSPNSDGMSIKITLEDVIDPVHSVAPTPTDTEFDLDPSAQESCDEDDEYVPRPFVSPPTQTTVTIIGRNADFSPPVSESASHFLTTPNAHPHQASRSGLYTSDDTGLGVFPNSPDPYLNDDQSAGMRKLEDYFIGPQLLEEPVKAQESGNPTQHEQQTTSEDEPIASRESQAAETPISLVPRSWQSPDSIRRSSQASVWTDYSVHSRQTRTTQLEGHDQPGLQSVITQREEALSSGSVPPVKISPFEKKARDSACSVAVSPRDILQDFAPEDVHREQLLVVDTGDDFAFDYSAKSNEAVSYVRHENYPPAPPPPPPPLPAQEASFREGTVSGPPSEYYDDSRPASFAHVLKDDQSEFSLDRRRPGSEVFTASESAARSTDQVSIATSDGPPTGVMPPDKLGSLPDDLLPPKEKKRLFTRLQTIKELIDTEAFFIRDMNIVEEIYKGTAEACPQLGDDTIKLIFRNTEEIIAFHTGFSAELKVGVASIYVPKIHRARPKGTSVNSDGSAQSAVPSGPSELNDERDRETSLGPIFSRNMEAMKAVHETFLKNSDLAAKRLIQIQENPAVKVWLNECNEVARELTKAWNLDSLLIKPMQRITKYPNLLIQLLGETPADHPDRSALLIAKEQLETAIEEINKTKKNFELVGQIVGRKRKDSDVRAGFARAFGKRVDKIAATSGKAEEDAEYNKLHEKFGDDYLRLQVVLRDVEFYTRQVTEYVHVFLQFLSSMELVMRLQPSPHPEIESKWVRFNVSMRDVEKVALAQHLSQVRKHVIEPFELVIKSYGNPSTAMKKRSKRRLDFEKSVQLKKNGKKIDKQTADGAEQYEALNETLKKELPTLSALTERVGNICLENLINIQAQWYSIWKDKVKMVLDDPATPEIGDIVTTFSRDYKFQEEQINAIGIVNPAVKGRPSQSPSTDESIHRLRPRPADLSPRVRGLSLNSDTVPSLPTPDFMKRHSGQFTMSPTAATLPSPSHQYYRDFYTGANPARPPMQAPAMTSEGSQSGRSMTAPARPGTGHSYDSSSIALSMAPSIPRQSTDSGAQVRSSTTSMQPSPYLASESQRFSGLFQSALPLPDRPDRPDRHAPSRPSRTSSRASSREREPINGYNVLWLAASLFEFNIETTKTEAGYPYLTYQAGEIFDVIGEKGELWLAKNQDDPANLVGWLWSKHFAKLADD